MKCFVSSSYKQIPQTTHILLLFYRYSVLHCMKYLPYNHWCCCTPG